MTVLLVPRARRSRLIGPALLVPAAAIGAHVVVEGWRWQLVPAYALGLGLALVGPLRRTGSWARLRRRRGVRLGVTVTGTVLGFGLLASGAALSWLLPVFGFPEPTGPYAVGTVTYDWVDGSRPEIFTADPDDHRELMAQVWYPAAPGARGEAAPYVRPAGPWARATTRIFGFPSFVLGHVRYVRTNALDAVPMAPGRDRFPVLVYQTGLGGFRAASTFQIEELVSHGYVVVGLDQPGASSAVTFPDGRTIPGLPKDQISRYVDQAVWPQVPAPVLNGVPLPDGVTPYFGRDASVALDRLLALDRSDPRGILTGRIDTERVGTFGISLGGMGVAQACAADQRFKACLVMDVYLPRSVVRSGLSQPTMFITRDADTMRLERERSGGWREIDISTTIGSMRTVFDHLPHGGYYVTIPRIFHVDFTDASRWLVPAYQAGFSGPLGAQRAHDIINAYTLAFFDTELKGRRPELLRPGGTPIAGSTVESRP